MGLAKLLGTIIALVLGAIAIYGLYITLNKKVSLIPEFFPEYGPALMLIQALFGGYVIFAILVAAQLFKGNVKKIVLICLLVCSLFLFFKKYPATNINCTTIGAQDYDTLLENTGVMSRTRQTYFCTEKCPCHLQYHDYLYVCNDIINDNVTAVNRTINECGEYVNCGVFSKTTNILECDKHYRAFDGYQKYQNLERFYDCAGWCLNCNMQVFVDSLKDIKPNYDEGKSCAKIIVQATHDLMQHLKQMLSGQIALLLVALVMEFFNEDDEKEKHE